MSRTASRGGGARARVGVGVSSSDRTFCPLPRDHHLSASPPLNEEHAVADLAPGQPIQPEPSVEGRRLEGVGYPDEWLIFQASCLPKALSDHNPDREGLGGGVLRPLVKPRVKLGAEPFRLGPREGPVIGCRLPLAGSDHPFGQSPNFPIERGR